MPGRLLDRILSNRAKTNYKYDADNRLTQLTNVSAGDGLNETQTYSYDNIGNITSTTDASGPAIFVYDPLYRLTSADYPGTADDVSYTYDGVGNRLTKTDAAGTLHYIFNNGGNRLNEVREGSVAGPIQYRYVYDDNGNRIEKRDGADTLIQSYVYDQKNRISALMTLTDTHHFAYDPNDYRISRMDSAGTRVHLLEGEHLEAVYDGVAQIQAKYLRGVVVDEIVNGYYYDEFGKKTNYTFHHDHLRSVVGLTAHEGSTVETTKYGAFGEEITSTGESDNFLKYTGREHDEELGLYYYRARYYDYEVGRFLTEDPLGFKAGINFYTYCKNNPVNNNDPDGLFNIFVGGGGTAAAPTGAEAAGGIVINPGLFGQRADAGFFASAGGTVGVNVSGDVFVGYVKGGIENVTGKTVNQNITIGPISITVFHDAETGEVMGGTFGVGPGVAPVGYSGAFDITGTATIRDFVNWVMPESQSAYSNSNVSATGGFVLYPNKPNLNMMQSVYAK